jgi:hypothetical protein
MGDGEGPEDIKMAMYTQSAYSAKRCRTWKTSHGNHRKLSYYFRKKRPSIYMEPYSLEQLFSLEYHQTSFSDTASWLNTVL